MFFLALGWNADFSIAFLGLVVSLRENMVELRYFFLPDSLCRLSETVKKYKPNAKRYGKIKQQIQDNGSHAPLRYDNGMCRER